MAAAGKEAGDDRGEELFPPPPPPLAGNYPKPISPPYPASSKAAELARAMSAASRSAAFALSDEEIVWEDEWISVVNKPTGIYCDAILPALSDRLPPSGTRNLHLANRLDRDTSGLMVVTHTNKASSNLVQAFARHQVKKTYIALCVGRVPTWRRLTISSGHGRSRFGAWRIYSASDVGRRLPGGSIVKQMTTSFEILSINGESISDQSDLDDASSTIVVECGGDQIPIREDLAVDGIGENEIVVRARPESGRTHQIRLHCQHLGISIKGDVKYGGVIDWRGVACDAHALHAETLTFLHPISGEPLFLRAPPPVWAATSLCLHRGSPEEIVS